MIMKVDIEEEELNVIIAALQRLNEAHIEKNPSVVMTLARFVQMRELLGKSFATEEARREKQAKRESLLD